MCCCCEAARLLGSRGWPCKPTVLLLRAGSAFRIQLVQGRQGARKSPANRSRRAERQFKRCASHRRAPTVALASRENGARFVLPPSTHVILPGASTAFANSTDAGGTTIQTVQHLAGSEKGLLSAYSGRELPAIVGRGNSFRPAMLLFVFTRRNREATSFDGNGRERGGFKKLASV